MKIVSRPATRAVPAAMADRLDPSPDPPPRKSPLTSFAKPRIRGLRTTMYAIVKKVTTPPRISRLTLDPLSVILKKRSTPLDGCGVDGRSTAVWDMAQRIVAGQADFSRASVKLSPTGVRDMPSGMTKVAA
jgi:hypothetical protein